MAQGAGYSFNSDTVSGSKVRDLSGYFLTGTIVGSAATATGKYGNGLNCTGGAMRVGPIGEFDYPVNTDGGLTVAAWVKLNTTTSAARCIASASAASALKWALYASNASGNVEAVIAGVTFSTSTSIRDSAFHHVMVVLDATVATDTVKIYVDGTQVLSTTTATALTYNGAVTMDAGRNALSGAQPLDGIIDDIRWWNDPVEAASIAAIVAAEQTDFQLAIYPFDDDTTDDFSIYNRDLTKTAAGSYTAGLYGRALSTSAAGPGASAAINLPDCDRLAITGWLRLDTAPVGSAAPILAIDSSGGSSRLRVVVNTDRSVTITWVTVYGTYSVTSASVLTVGAWSRFQVAMNPTYVNIRLDSSTQQTTNTSNATPVLSPTVTDLDVLYVGGDASVGGQVTFDYLTFTKNFVNSPTDLYWAGAPVAQTALKPANVARGVYEFNENTGTAAADRSPAGNNLTLTAAGSWVTGVQGSALGSNGAAGAGARRASGVNWSAAPKGWAFSGWVKCRTSTSGARFLTMRAGGTEVAHAGRLSGLFWVRLYGAGGTTGIINPSVAPITAETWTHVAASCNGNSIQFFLNGVWVASAAYTMGALLVPTELNVGGDPGGDAAVADVDSLTLFDTPFSASNVAWLYANPGQFVVAPVGVDLALATETDAALALVRSKAATLNRPTETDAALGITASKARTLSAASETDAALAAVASKQVTLGVATETDAAAALSATYARTVTIGQASEADTAHAVVATKTVVLGVASEADAVFALLRVKQVTLGSAAETDAAHEITTGAGPGAIFGVATETDTARPLAASKATTLGQASETDLARPLVLFKTVILSVATETDAAAALTAAKARTLGVAAEIDAAYQLVFGAVVPPVEPTLTATNSHSSDLTAWNQPSSQLEASHGV